MLKTIKKYALLAMIFAFLPAFISTAVSAHTLKSTANIETFVELSPLNERNSAREALTQLYDLAKTNSIEFKLNSVNVNTEFNNEMSTASASCTINTTAKLLDQEAPVSATAATCIEAYDMLKELIGEA